MGGGIKPLTVLNNHEGTLSSYGSIASIVSSYRPWNVGYSNIVFKSTVTNIKALFLISYQNTSNISSIVANKGTLKIKEYINATGFNGGLIELNDLPTNTNITLTAYSKNGNYYSHGLTLIIYDYTK